MINKDTILSNEFLFLTAKLEALQEAVGRLEEARIGHDAKLDVCFFLMREAATTQDATERDDALKALSYTMKMTARHIRQSIAKKPRHAGMLKNIELDEKKVKDMKVGTYRALLPFAVKEFEVFDCFS